MADESCFISWNSFSRELPAPSKILITTFCSASHSSMMGSSPASRAPSQIRHGDLQLLQPIVVDVMLPGFELMNQDLGVQGQRHGVAFYFLPVDVADGAVDLRPELFGVYVLVAFSRSEFGTSINGIADFSRLL